MIDTLAQLCHNILKVRTLEFLFLSVVFGLIQEFDEFLMCCFEVKIIPKVKDYKSVELNFRSLLELNLLMSWLTRQVLLDM